MIIPAANKKGVVVIMAVCTIAAILLVFLTTAQLQLYHMEEQIVRERSRIESEITLRACMSAAFIRYINGLRRFPKAIKNGDGSCTLQSVSTTNTITTMYITDSSQYVYVSARATFDNANLKLISFSFE